MLTLKTEFIVQDERIEFFHFTFMGCLPVRELSRAFKDDIGPSFQKGGDDDFDSN